jgi:putative membrane protein insertion efficiency factor/ribonuclease P protein component
LTFTKADRLLKRGQFLKLADRAARIDVKIRAGVFLVVGRDNGLGRHRLGVTVTKKIGPAVVRNRLKRQVREFFRQNRPEWPGGLDLLFIARQPAGALPRPKIREALARAGRELAAFRPATEGGSVPGGSVPGGSVPDGSVPGGSAPATTADVLATTVPAIAPNSRFSDDQAAKDDQSLSAMGPGPSALVARLALGGIIFYHRCISPFLPPACRFWPTCSNYAVSAIRIHGIWRGAWLTTLRLLKCHPFHPGGYDPVPPVKPRQPDSHAAP